jgi:hypothetical protein
LRVCAASQRVFFLDDRSQDEAVANKRDWISYTTRPEAQFAFLSFSSSPRKMEIGGAVGRAEERMAEIRGGSGCKRGYAGASGFLW